MEASKRQSAEWQPFLDLPSNAVLCCRRVPALQLSPWIRDNRSGECDGRTILWYIAICQTARGPAGFLEGNPAYLHRDVTTVQRWEKREGMPRAIAYENF